MRILFDQGTPAPLRTFLIGHEVRTAAERGWDALTNGALLTEAESAFEMLITKDQNLRHQQNLSNRKLRVLVLLTTSWPRIRREVQRVQDTVNTMTAGEYREIEFR